MSKNDTDSVDAELRELIKSVRSNRRMILYTDQLGRPDEDNQRDQCSRDDLWAISSGELDQILQLLTQARKGYVPADCTCRCAWCSNRNWHQLCTRRENGLCKLYTQADVDQKVAEVLGRVGERIALLTWGGPLGAESSHEIVMEGLAKYTNPHTPPQEPRINKQQGSSEPHINKNDKASPQEQK